MEFHSVRRRKHDVICRAAVHGRQANGGRSGIPPRLLLLALALGGCTPESVPAPPVPVAPAAPPSSFSLPADQPWVDTGLRVTAGEVLSTAAAGTITVVSGSGRDGRDVHVGPEGTYLYEDDAAVQPFPLAAGALGPAPPYCLIGRIGDGPPFYVGPRKSWAAAESGPLLLGINDYDFADNCGELAVTISRPLAIQPLAFQTPVPPDAAAGGAVCGSSVVVFYIDGLRPDVVREMAAMGHLPHITTVFLEGGLEAARCYTAFPSDTITSNGTMWTGCFSDRHGIKGQVRFSRRTLHSESYLDPAGPSRAARLLAPQGIDKVLHNLHAETIGLVKGDAAEERYRQTRVTGVAPLFEHLRRRGGEWATGALPMMTEMPPVLWSRSLVRHLPYFHTEEAWNTIDDANTHYALFDLLDRRSPVTIIWLPETDSVSHKCGRGQFGLTRRTIARADVLIGRVVEQLRALGRLECTYLFLVSDHGHHGGRDSHLSQFDIANELFYKPREVTPDGCWTAGGLGLSVRQHRFWNRHKEDGSREFVFLDGDSDGAARIFLPRGHFRSGRWMGPHRPGDLLAYRISERHAPINLLEVLTAVRAPHGNGYVEPPVDLVLVKLDDASVLIATGDRGCAVIDRRLDDCGRWLYRYTPVADVCEAGDGGMAYAPLLDPQADPLGLAAVLGSQGLREYYDEQTWLNVTAGTRYPDSVVALTRHMLWQENLRYRECEFAPDLVVTARPGWYFGTYATPGTTHGYPLADAMQATLFLAGPNIRRGARLEQPCRLVDLTPTILEMTATPYVSSELDGHALRTIYDGFEPSWPEAASLLPNATDPSGGLAARRYGGEPVYWHDVDLGAWYPLCYQKLPAYAHLPLTVHDPNSRLDLNNMVYNAATVTEINVLRVFDDVLSPLSGGPSDRGLLPRVERCDLRLRTSSRPWLADLPNAAKIPLVTIGDYSQTSVGNLRRASAGVDWLQGRAQAVDRRLAAPLGFRSLPGTPLVHGTIDAVQACGWDLYIFGQRVAVETLDEKLLNHTEDTLDRIINHPRRQPAEVLVRPQR